MAGIEQIEVHSKSYLVRWIQVPEQHSISWSVQPHKKSINFGIFKHPGTKNGLTPNLPTEETVENPSQSPGTPSGTDGAAASGHASRRASMVSSGVAEKLQSIGLKSVAWNGKCEADKVCMGRYDVADGEGGTYGLVFDNTFSKQTSKNITLVLMTHPTSVPPRSGHHLHYSQAFASQSNSSLGKGSSPSLKPVADSNESLPPNASLHRAVLEDPRPPSKKGHAVESKGAEGTTFYTGVLNKKRRKKGQGFTKRFFSLDFTSSTLSYYRNRHSSALRGAVPLSLTAIGANEKTREFSIDSGAEVWHLKAGNIKDFEGWRDALERASTAANHSTPATPSQNLLVPRTLNPLEEREWARVEQLISKVAGTRDAVRRLATDTEPKGENATNGVGLGVSSPVSGINAVASPTPQEADSYFPEVEEKDHEKRPFWKRKSSADRSPSALMRRSVSAQLAVPSPSIVPGMQSPTSASITQPKRATEADAAASRDAGVHERCMALLRDLDTVVADFAALIAESRGRRLPPPMASRPSRRSMESVDGEEFFDAEDGGDGPSQLLNISRSDEYDEGQEEQEEEQEEQASDHESDDDSDTSSEVQGGAAEAVHFTSARKADQSPLFPSLPEELSPLPLSAAKRRTTVTPPKQNPPSIIGFLRKNAGKDLSTVSMPVTANEPTSLLQRLAESMEYSQLLDAAAGAGSAEERMMYVAAFAVSYFAYNRVKERAIRKPFNPMLGETFELVREDLGFRFIAEKVSHHPVRMACQAESLNNGGWSYTQSPKPIQKFWGKSVELNTEGRARVMLHQSGDQYSWSQATCFLRNVIAGEKYVEPVQNMTIANETNGMRALVSFKAGGMFSGRAEETNVEIFEESSPNKPLPLGLSGRWTDSLKRTDNGNTIWKVGSLVADSAKVYGFTTFAAALNEVTDVERDKLPPTDTRLRPDQQALESGDVDKAEATKARLEERQRARRKVLEGHGQTWKPQFFEKLASDSLNVKMDPDEEIWILKQKGGYWEKRSGGNWDGVQEVFET